ncbi:MAG: methyl-accepting chemotaxis protein [Leptospiraceae bacterium]|nr:methyl-accepting chemotaxis protein [Leptospiraceae bacterium]
MTDLLSASRLGNLMDPSLFKDKISLEKKIFSNLISVTILSSGSIGFLFYFVNTGTLKFSYPFVVILIFLISFTLFIYISNKNLSNSIKANHEIISSSLSELSKGKISMRIPIVSKDEYGLMAYDLIQVVIALRRTVESLIKIISEITIYSKQMEANSEVLLNLIVKQSKTFENFVNKLDEINKATQVSQNSSQKTNQLMQETKKIQEDIDYNVKNLLNYTSQSEKQASISLQFIDSGKQNMQSNIQIMTQVQHTTLEIQSIVSAIGEVADQVNLLSLNASIESARAGDYGRGFAVVASEISKLAERVLQNSEEIKKISKIVNKNVSEGVESINSTGRLFEEIHEKIMGMKERIESINQAARSQISSNEDFKKIFQNSIEMSSEILKATSIQVENVKNLLNEIQILNQESSTLKNKIEDFQSIAQNLKERIQTIQTQVNFFT